MRFYVVGFTVLWTNRKEIFFWRSVYWSVDAKMTYLAYASIAVSSVIRGKNESLKAYLP